LVSEIASMHIFPIFVKELAIRSISMDQFELQWKSSIYVLMNNFCLNDNIWILISAIDKHFKQLFAIELVIQIVT